MKKNSLKSQSLLNFALLTGILLFINILAQAFWGRIDLTEDKRYSLTDSTVGLLNTLKEPVYVRILLDGEFPAGFKRLQSNVKEMLDYFKAESGYIEYTFEDPNKGSTEQINETRKKLYDDGIFPTNLRLNSSDEKTEKIIYPYAIFTYRGKTLNVNFLESESPGVSQEEILNNSVGLLEYKFANAIQKLKAQKKPPVVFTTGKGELTKLQTLDLEKSLSPYFRTGRINLDSTFRIDTNIALLVVAQPKLQFSEKNKFLLDQYIMNGGKVLWLIDRLNANLDSMSLYPDFLPTDYPLNLEDQLFKYGARIQPNLVLDLECSRIPLVTGQLGNKPQTELFPWFYHPIVAPKSNHPIVKSLDRINLLFPSSIDTVKTKTNIKKTILLNSSKYSRIQLTPVRLNFEILRYDPDPTKFNKPNQNLAVLLEGEFPSLYENRVTEEMNAALKKIGTEFKTISKPTKQVVVSDGDIAKNLVNMQDSTIAPLGLNKFENYVFANKDFLLNVIEYMINDEGVIEARGKDVKLRLLDVEKTKAEKTFWQTINIVIPIGLLLLFGLGYYYWRRKKYAQ